MKKLGTLVRTEREHAGLKGYEFAKAINKQPSWVTRLESGEAKTLPPPEELERIGRTLHLSMRQLVEAAGYAMDDAGATDARLAAIHTRIDPYLRQLTTRHIDTLVQMCELWLEAAEIRQSRAPDSTPDAPPPSSEQRTGPPSPDDESTQPGSGRYSVPCT